MSVLAAAVSRTMTASTRDLAVLDRGTGQWSRHPFQEVHARAENIAERIGDGPDAVADRPRGRADGGTDRRDPGRLACRPGAVDPSRPHPRRRRPQWARATAERFADIGVTQVFSHGCSAEPVARATVPGWRCTMWPVRGTPQRSTTFAQQSAPGGTPAVLQGTAGSTGTPRTAALSPEAVLDNVTGLLSASASIPPWMWAARGYRSITTWG